MDNSQGSKLITCRAHVLHSNGVQIADGASSLSRPNSLMTYKRLGRAPTNEELTVATNKFWGIEGAKLTVSFLDSPSKALKDKILSHLNAWNLKANVEFVETQDIDGAIVRINRETMNNRVWDGYWCFLGTDMINNHGPNNQTMNLEGFTENFPDSEFRRVVRHEAGHALGFEHEHCRKDIISKIDRDKAITYYKELANWTPTQVDQQVLKPLNDGEWVGTPESDETSIMTYQVPSEITVDGRLIVGGFDISPIDHEYAALIYPKVK